MKVSITADLVKRAAFLADEYANKPADQKPHGTPPDEQTVITFDSLNEKIIIANEYGDELMAEDY